MNELLSGLNGGSVPTLELIYLLTLVALLPSIVIMMTSFTRIIIILLAGIAFFLTLYIMSPTLNKINAEAYEPYKKGTVTQEEALNIMGKDMKEFMLRNTEKATLDRFVSMSKVELQKDPKDYPLTVVTPAFMTSELKRGFTAGFLIYLPFLLIDVVVSTTLMAMGMVMLPPAMVSMPFKLLLFITVDGWNLLFSSVVNSFR